MSQARLVDDDNIFAHHVLSQTEVLQLISVGTVVDQSRITNTALYNRLQYIAEGVPTEISGVQVWQHRFLASNQYDVVTTRARNIYIHILPKRTAQVPHLRLTGMATCNLLTTA